jgi:hypothetical protein
MPQRDERDQKGDHIHTYLVNAPVFGLAGLVTESVPSTGSGMIPPTFEQYLTNLQLLQADLPSLGQLHRLATWTFAQGAFSITMPEMNVA